jgi:hypothetical protein
MAKKHPVKAEPPIYPPVVSAFRHLTAPPQRDLTKSADFFSIYTNDLQIQTSSWDVRMTLGESGDVSTGDPAVVSIKLLGELRMSPQLAKKTALILIEQLKAYEEQFGQIPGPKD